MGTTESGRRTLSHLSLLPAVGMLLAFVPQQASAAPVCPCSADQVTCQRQAGWQIAESPNFSVWTTGDQRQAVNLSLRCETLRMQLQERWCGIAAEAWRPKCVVVVHLDEGAYSAAIGTRLDPSAGCTTVTIDQGEVIFRRIDLRGDVAQWQVNGLPHELTHVVLADVFRDTSLPQWLHEGLAMTSESAELQQRRLSLLQTEQAEWRLPAISDLFSPLRRATRSTTEVHYSASYALVLHLQQFGGASKLLEFAHSVPSDGHVEALRAVYGLHEGVSGLERQWNSSIAGLKPIPMELVALTD